MKNRIRETIETKGGDILNVYFTAGFPELNDTVAIIKELEKNGVDLIELGMPYSDPLADGMTIQQSSEKALRNGMSLKLIFEQVKRARKTARIPIIMMGYFNQLLQYGEEKFLSEASAAGVDGLIIPDMPMDIYETEYQDLFSKYQLSIAFLISPMTSNERVQQADRLSSAFIYVVSQSSITGKSNEITDAQKAYFKRIKDLNLDSPTLIGFGIHDQSSYQIAVENSRGAIIGSAFIRALEKEGSIAEKVNSFIKKIRP